MNQIRKPKTTHDVRGDKVGCANFQKCPLCYGCRRFSDTDPECLICMNENRKMNICNTELHKEDVVARFITRELFEFNEPITFTNLSEERN